MSNGQSLNDMMRLASGQDWSMFDALDPAVKDGVDPRIAKQEQELERQRISSAAARIFSTPEGELVLDAILDKTLRRTCYFAMLGIDPGQVAMFGAFREGQNALVTEILRLIAEGRGEPQPPQRGVQDA
jgi:hypothetical protein